jgi:hypothetical protein
MIALRACIAAAMISVAISGFADNRSANVVLTGITEMAGRAELRFDAWPAVTGTLRVIPSDSESKPVSKSFRYTIVQQASREFPVGSTFSITFPDKQSLTISCDTESNNCHSDGYVNELGATFSLLWRLASSG